MQPNRLSAILILASVAVFISCNQATSNEKATTEPAAKSEDSKKVDVVKTFYPMLEKGDWAGIEKITSPDFSDHMPWSPAPVKGRDSLIHALKDFHASFPNMKYEILNTAVDNDLVFVHYHFTGSNDGPFMGMPATNKKVDFNGVDLIRVKDGIATEHWDYGDNITFQKQMGLMP